MFRFSILLFCFLACGNTKTVKPTPRPKPKTTQTTPKPPVSTKKSEGIHWVNSETLMPVLEFAQQEQKPVFVDFYASWCGPCKVITKEVLEQPYIYQYMNEAYLNFVADYDRESGKKIAELFEVPGLPTLLFLSPKGEVLERHSGLITPEKFMQLARSAKNKMK